MAFFGKGLLQTAPGRFRRPPWFVGLLLLAIPLALGLATLQEMLLGDWAHIRLLAEVGQSRSARSAFVGLTEELFQANLGRALWTDRRPHESSLPRVDLILEPEDVETQVLQERQGDLPLWEPKSGQRPRAFFRKWGDPFVECRFSLRGFSSWHLGSNKPSFRLRFSKRRFPVGFRWLDYSRPEDAWAICNWLPDELASKIGLVNARTKHVRLFLNRQFKGVYLESARPGPRLALQNGRLPGVFFKGDDLSVQSIWEHPELFAIKGNEQGDGVEAWFGEFLGLVADSSRHYRDRSLLGTFLDEESLAKATALNLYVGTTHADDRHNQMLYLSSYRGLLEVVPWDLNAYGIHHRVELDVNYLSHRLLALAYRDPRFLYLRDQWLHKLLTWKKETRSLFESITNTLHPDLTSDPYLVNLYKFNPDDKADLGSLNPLLADRVMAQEVSPEELESRRQELHVWMDTREKFLENYLNRALVSLTNESGESRVGVFGNVAIKARHKEDSQQDLILFPHLVVRNRFATAIPRFYNLAGAPENWTFENAITGEAVTPSDAHPQLRPEILKEIYTLEVPPEKVHPQPEELTLGPGVVHLTEDVVYPTGTIVEIHPGTELVLGPEVDLLFRGQVKMRGSKEEPIRIRADGAPFGTVSVLGHGSAGSVLEHVRMSGGSRSRLGALDLKGMFNAYDCPDITLNQCQFRDNKMGDDAVNIALSKARVVGCEFSDTLMDALDLDGCDAEVSECRFVRVGNDGLDIMETELRCRENEFEDCGDKGISIGEESRTVIENCTFLKCPTGVEMKDGSRTRVEDSSFETCGTGVRAYRKKWLFVSGGYGELRRCQFTDCVADLELDKDSRLWLKATEVRGPEQNGDRITRDGLFLLGDGPSVTPSR